MNEEIFDEYAKYSKNLREINNAIKKSSLQALNCASKVRLPLEAIQSISGLSPHQKTISDADIESNSSQLSELVKNLSGIEYRIGEPIRIAILGGFNAGKSTLINSILEVLIGRKLEKSEKLAVDYVPTTKQIFVIGHPESPPPPEETRIRFNQINAKPLRYFQFLDTPGKGDEKVFDDLAIQYLSRCDAVLYLLSLEKPLDLDDKKFIEMKLRNFPSKPIWYVITHAARLLDDKGGSINIDKDELSRFTIDLENRFKSSIASYEKDVMSLDLELNKNYFVIDSPRFGVDIILRKILESFATTTSLEKKTKNLKNDLMDGVESISSTINDLSRILGNSLDYIDLTLNSLISRVERQIWDTVARQIALQNERFQNKAIAQLTGIARLTDKLLSVRVPDSATLILSHRFEDALRPLLEKVNSLQSVLRGLEAAKEYRGSELVLSVQNFSSTFSLVAEKLRNCFSDIIQADQILSESFRSARNNVAHNETIISVAEMFDNRLNTSIIDDKNAGSLQLEERVDEIRFLCSAKAQDSIQNRVDGLIRDIEEQLNSVFLVIKKTSESLIDKTFKSVHELHGVFIVGYKKTNSSVLGGAIERMKNEVKYPFSLVLREMLGSEPFSIQEPIDLIKTEEINKICQELIDEWAKNTKKEAVILKQEMIETACDGKKSFNSRTKVLSSKLSSIEKETVGKLDYLLGSFNLKALISDEIFKFKKSALEDFNKLDGEMENVRTEIIRKMESDANKMLVWPRRLIELVVTFGIGISIIFAHWLFDLPQSDALALIGGGVILLGVFRVYETRSLVIQHRNSVLTQICMSGVGQVNHEIFKTTESIKKHIVNTNVKIRDNIDMVYHEIVFEVEQKRTLFEVELTRVSNLISAVIGDICCKLTNEISTYGDDIYNLSSREITKLGDSYEESFNKYLKNTADQWFDEVKKDVDKAIKTQRSLVNILNESCEELRKAKDLLEKFKYK